MPLRVSETLSATNNSNFRFSGKRNILRTSCLFWVSRSWYRWIGDIRDVAVLQEGSLRALSAQPPAASDERDIGEIPFLFPFQYLGRQIVFTGRDEERATAAPLFKTAALPGIMANAGKRPHIVHRPDNGLPQLRQSLNILDR